MSHVTHSLSFTDIIIFSPGFSKFCYIKKYRWRLHFGTQFLTGLTFIESLRIFLIKVVIILMMSVKMATPGLLKITVFLNKGHDVIIPVDDVTNKVLSCDSNYIVNMSMWSTLAFLWEKLSQPQFCKYLTRKTTFFRVGLGSSSIIWDWY